MFTPIGNTNSKKKGKTLEKVVGGAAALAVILRVGMDPVLAKDILVHCLAS